jgi:hypothetical protein
LPDYGSHCPKGDGSLLGTRTWDVVKSTLAETEVSKSGRKFEKELDSRIRKNIVRPPVPYQ